MVTEYDSKCIIYDSEGTAWGFHYVGRKEKFSLFDRLLAEVYNPSREFPVSYSKLRGYQLAELQGAYLDGVAHDGDILKAERTLGYEGETVDEGETVVWRAFPCM